ncbi:MAG: GNAT family N-acetyltransferase [Alphaproteobacteria bacterium]|nr:GNAT family N-acetyltransferase [Alphaproteobacteria bacterium]
MKSRNEFEFRKAAETDLPFLVRLRADAMRAHILSAGMEYDDELQMQRVMDNFDCAQIIRLEGKDIGLLKVDRASDPWMLKQIQLRPEYQNKGLGEKILRQILGDAREKSVDVGLQVYKNNPAKRFYERAGFNEVGRNDIACTMQWKCK